MGFFFYNMFMKFVSIHITLSALGLFCWGFFPPGKLWAKFYQLEFNHMSPNNYYHIDTLSMLNRGYREIIKNPFQRDLFHSFSHSIKMSQLFIGYNEVMVNSRNDGVRCMTVNEDFWLENTNAIDPQQSKYICRLQLLGQVVVKWQTKSYQKTKRPESPLNLDICKFQIRILYCPIDPVINKLLNCSLPYSALPTS